MSTTGLNFEAFSNRLPPQNVDAEESILGGILLDPEAIGRVADLLRPEALYISSHKEIYKAALALYSQGKPTDLMSVTTWLYDHKLLEKVGGTSTLAQLVERTVSAVNVDRYAMLVMDKYLRRQLIQAGNEIVQLGYEASTELETVLEQSEQKVFKVAGQRSCAINSVEPVNEILVRNFQEIEEYAQGISQPGLNTGLVEVDRLTGGLQRQDLIILAGRPSTGKTALGLNMAHNIAVLHKLPVVIFSLEMSKEQLTYRLLARIARIECERLKAGRIALGEWEPLSRAVGELSELNIFIDDRANPSIFDIRAALRLVASNHGQLGMVLVDYLQLMGSDSNSSFRVQELDKITRSLKQLAKDFNVPVVCISQLNRGVENRQDKRPTISDLRDSGAIEQVADLVALVYREDYYNSNTPDRGIVEMIVGKQRNGSTGTIKLFFEREYSRFIDLYYQ